MPALDRPVVLTGPPGAGKSALAPRLAHALGVPWADSDAEVTRGAGGATVAELFSREGEAGFRARERIALQALLERAAPHVIAAGGGALLDPAFRRAVLARAWVLALDAPAHVLAARLAGASDTPRPLLGNTPGDALDQRIFRLLCARADGYAEAHAALAAAAPPDALLASARALLDELSRAPSLVVPLGARTYRVHIAPLATLVARVRALAPSAVVAVTDRRVLRAPGVEATLAALRPDATATLRGRGDADKSLRTLARVWDAALAAGIDRGACVVGVGGGVVTDMAGFAAATLLRGVSYASAPTTLLAMADAAVGGKTGIDHARGKNLLGAFHQPRVVVADTATLATLPPRELRAGLAEVAKAALACAPDLARALAAGAPALARLELAAIASVLPRAVQAKIDVVARDEREGAAREVLNFGHTIGHALELAAGFSVPHGECVAVGMRAELALGEALGITPAGVAREARALLDALALPSRVPARLDRAAAHRALASDKKRRGGRARVVLLTAMGAAITVPVAADAAARALDDVLQIRADARRKLPSR